MKKFFGENEVEAVLQRLDRLTQDEARTTAAQTLGVVYGLVQNMRVIIDGMRILLTFHSWLLSALPIDGKASVDGVRDALGMFYLQ